MKVRRPPKAQVYEIPLYAGLIYFFTDRAAFKRSLRDVTEVNLDVLDTASGLTVTVPGEDQAIYVVGIFEGGLRTLVHEMLHVTLEICDRVGMDPVAANGEPACYLMDTLFDRFQGLVAGRGAQ